MQVQMVLGKIIFPQNGRVKTEELYYRKKGNVQKADKELILEKGTTVSFDTYFNSFPASTWRKYAYLWKIYLRITLCGMFRLRLCRMYMKRKKTQHQVLTEIELPGYTKMVKNSVAQANMYEYAFPGKPLQGESLYFELLACEKGCRVYGAEYFTKIQAEKIHPVRLAVGICTYKREAYVKKNISLMSKHLANEKSILHGNMEVFVADNGQTLGKKLKKFPFVHVYQNPNLGGAGGFTRCMMEVMRENKEKAGFTHLLLMDDDVQFEWESIEKTYRLLCLLVRNYQDAFLAGAMLQEDLAYLQAESGGIFGKYGNQPLKKGLDMRRVWDCLENDRWEHADYAAWWYCCFPTQILNEDNLPLPFFIHGDDVEWGLRSRKPIIRMNGICIWHKTQESKARPERIYYNIRNLLVCFARYGTWMSGVRMALLLWKQFFHDAYVSQYKDIRAALQGAKDFLKGPSFFQETDADTLQQKLTAVYSMPVAYSYKHFFKYFVYTMQMTFRLTCRYAGTAKMYRVQFPNMQTWEFWERKIKTGREKQKQ